MSLKMKGEKVLDFQKLVRKKGDRNLTLEMSKSETGYVVVFSFKPK